jgi:hypothetical protein
MDSAMFALCCDADIFVYVEQDCFAFGSDILDAAMGTSSADIF